MIPDITSAENLSSRLSTWLLRPYLDLGAMATGPLHVRRVEQCWRAFDEAQSPPFVPQRALPPGFRAQLIQEAGLQPYAVDDPRQLPDSLATGRWRVMCAAIECWNDLSAERRCRLMVLTNSLCMYQCVLDLVPQTDSRGLRNDPRAAELAYLRAFAKYMQGLPSRISDYSSADMSDFEDIARHALSSVPAGFNAAIRVLVHNAKVGAPHDSLAELAARAERALASTLGQVDFFMTNLLISRFHRAMGFVPQRRGDRAEVIRQMDLAEHHAYAMKPATAAQEVLYLENLHALMESRTKEALWLGDNDLAISRALKVTEVDPYDSKAWVELGQVRMVRKEWALAAEAYAIAGMLGPPASAVGRHMAGLCLRELGQDFLAAFFYKEALEIDPQGISPRDEICDLPDTAVLRALQEWQRSTVRF